MREVPQRLASPSEETPLKKKKKKKKSDKGMVTPASGTVPKKRQHG